jgi:hypothetical protein
MVYYFLPFDPFFWFDLLSAPVMLEGVLELLWSDRLLFTGGSSAPFFFLFIALIAIGEGCDTRMLKLMRRF